MLPRRRSSVPSVGQVLLFPFTLLGLLLGWLVRFRTIRLALLIGAGSLLILALEGMAVTSLVGNEAVASVLFLALVAGTMWGALRVYRTYSRRRRFGVQRFESLLALTPTQFEHAIGSLLSDFGYRDVAHSGMSGDLAADLVCRDQQGRSVVVQCKRHAPGMPVGSPAVQAFIGMMSVHHRAERGIFVTTSTFTGPAVALAREHNLELIDGVRLAELIRNLDKRRRD